MQTSIYLRKIALLSITFLFCIWLFLPNFVIAQELSEDCVTEAQFLSGSYDNTKPACQNELSAAIKYCGHLQDDAQRLKAWQNSQFGDYFIFKWPRTKIEKIIAADGLRQKVLLDSELSDDAGRYFFVLTSGIFSTSLMELVGDEKELTRSIVNGITNPQFYKHYFIHQLPLSSQEFIRHLECAVSCGSNSVKMTLLVRAPIYQQCLGDEK